MSFPVDIQSVKNTKLFKKFMESKNKSISITQPRMENVDINIKPAQKYLGAQDRSQQKIETHKYSTSPKRQIRQIENPSIVKPSYKRENETFKKVNEDFVYETKDKNIAYNNYSSDNSQRNAETVGRQKIGKEDQNYALKYEKLLEQFNQLKDRVAAQRKQYRKQMIKLEQQADLLNKKVFQLRSKEDQLILQNKRLKQKSITEIKERKEIQQSNRQLTFEVQQLKDMLDGQSNSVKKKQDETSHWRKINDDLRQRIRQLQSEVAKQKDLCNMTQREKFVMEKQVSNKQLHLNQMRQKINSLITENGVLRDEIFHITSKLYQFEQENKSLKSDLRRHSDDFPMSYLQQKLQQASHYSKVAQNNSMIPQNSRHEVQQNSQKRTQRRRGFAKQRGMRKAEHTNEQKQQVAHNLSTSNMNTNKQIGQTIRKLQQLNEQLQKLKDMKAMNGTMRRQKINIQRQIQQLQQFLKSRQ